MATLVQFLAAGVKGAESGTATFVLRGTASSAASVLYSDFEGTTQPGTNVITLDANGAAEVYCDAYVDVTLKNSAGATLRTVTLGNSAPLVEVQSASFTGTDYDGSPSNTAGEPITLKALLDKWITSAGSTDWKVLAGGVATNLQTALAGISGMFINVKDPTYGAAGDGVTNDTAAILAAIAAASSAGGGIVFFPPGTYQVTALNPSAPEVTLMGCGPDASNIRGTSAGSRVLVFTDNTSSAFKRVTGLKFTSSASYTALIEVEQSQKLVIDHCEFDQSNVTDAAILRLDVDGTTNLGVTACTFSVESADSAIQNLSDDSESFITVQDCIFSVSSSFTGAIIDGPDFHVSRCKFSAAAVTSGTYYHVDAASNENTGRYIGTFIGNRFIDGGSSGFAFKLTALGSSCSFIEDGNAFSGFVAPSASGEKGHIYDITDADSGVPGLVQLGSRKGRIINVANSASTFTASMCLEAEYVVIESSTATTVTVTVPALIPGLSGRVAVFGTSGSPVVEFRGSTVDGASVSAIDTTTLSTEIMFADILNNGFCSAGYATVTRADGVFYSMIAGVFNHVVAV